MATTEHFYTGNNSTTDYSFTFPYLKTDDIKVTLDAVATTAYSLPNSTTVRFNTAPGTGVDIHIFRDTDVDTAKAVFAAGSSVRAVDLNNNEDQALYSLQEKQGQLVKTTDIKDGAVTSAKIFDGTIVNADINASAAIAGSKLVAASTSVPGSMSAADKTKLDGIETAATADQTNAEIRAAVEAATDSNVFTDADHTKLNGIEASATADQTNAEIRAAVEAATDSNVFTDADHTKLNGIETSATADQTASEIKSLIASSPLDASHLAADSVTTSEIADAELTTLAGMQSGTASKLAGGTALTADLADLNQIDGLTKQTTLSDSDASFPTSGAVVDYVAAQIAPLGGLEVVATDAAFPNTQPASGVVISIADAGGVVVNGSGVSTTGRTVGGSTVTVNGFPSSLYSETLVAGVGLMVSSTGSSQTYNYHKILGKEDDIKQLSDDINDFNARYRVGSSNPSSALDDGDLFFNTGTGKMLVYNATNTAWEEVQSVGNFFINTISSYSGTGGNSASFNGSAYRFVLSNAPTNAEQLLVSISGVVQKPVAGTSQPSEGFSIDGSSIIFSSAPASGSDYFIITIGSAVNIGTPSNNTVTNAILQSGCVDNAKVATNAAIAGSKLADDSIAEVKLDVHNAPSGTDKFLAYTSNGMEWAVPTDTNTQLAFANDANNRVVTGDGSGGLNGEANLTFDGASLGINDSSNVPTINFTAPTSGPYDGYIQLRGNDLEIRGSSGNTEFYTGAADGASSTERLRITASGEVKINRSSDGGIGGNIILENAHDSDTDKVAIAFRPNGSPATAIGSFGESRIIGEYDSGSTNGSNNLQFWTHSGNGTVTERLRIKSGGDVEVKTGNLIIGTSGKGIDFSANSHAGGMTSEVLDSYEEGTWTPAVHQGVSNTQQFDAVGNYTKIGNRVYCQFLLQWTGTGDGNRVQFQGLPFTSVSTNALGGGTCVWNNVTGLAETSIQLIAKRDDTIIECWKDGGTNATTSSSFTNKAFYGRLDYMVA